MLRRRLSYYFSIREIRLTLLKALAWFNLTAAAALLALAAYGFVVVLFAPTSGMHEKPSVLLSALFIGMLAVFFFAAYLAFKRNIWVKWILQLLPFVVVAYAYLQSIGD